MNESNDLITILVIDDEAVVRQGLCDLLEDLGYRVVGADNGRTGIDMLKREHPDLILTDLRMPEMGGLEVIQHSKQMKPDVPIIVISGAGRINDAVEALRLGAYDYLVKPINDLSMLHHTVEKALEKSKLKHENRAYQERLEELVKDRTRELEQANLKLININLDLNSEIKARARTEEELKSSEQRLRTIIDTIPSMISVKNAEGRYLSVNKSTADSLCMTVNELVGKLDSDVMPASDKSVAMLADDRRVLESGRELDIDQESYLDNTGATRWLQTLKVPCAKSVFGEPALLRISVDITRLMQTEDSLRRAQKMDAIGQLTGGIAHDFNNILGIIQGNLDLLKRQVVLDDKASKRVETIQRSAQRAADLTKQLLGFSRRQTVEVAATDINKEIEEMGNLIARSVTPQVEIEYRFADDLWLTAIAAGDFHDALLNLTLNARDAMGARGQLTIETNNCKLDAHYCEHLPGAIPGEYVQLMVSDTGEGVAPELQERIFEPFFTTKESGKGTGLGLAMVYGFVKRSGGHLEVYSVLGSGTTFRLHLPRTEGLERPSTKIDAPTEALPRGNETILVVDDEAGLLELARESLEALGYRVLTAGNGLQALARLAEEPAIDLLFSDVVMPGGINGYELAERATAEHRDLKVQLTSGYTEKAEVPNGQTRFKSSLLSKPYTQTELALRVRVLLGERKVIDMAHNGLAKTVLQSAAAVAERKDELSVDRDEMDDDHRKQLMLLKHCQRLSADEMNREALNVSLTELVEYTKDHFQREETEMAAHGYPGLVNHRQVHSLLMKQVREKQKRYRQGDMSIQELLVFLNSWLLVDHIQTMDRAFDSYFKRTNRNITKV